MKSEQLKEFQFFKDHFYIYHAFFHLVFGEVNNQEKSS